MTYYNITHSGSNTQTDISDSWDGMLRASDKTTLQTQGAIQGIFTEALEDDHQDRDPMTTKGVKGNYTGLCSVTPPHVPLQYNDDTSGLCQSVYHSILIVCWDLNSYPVTGTSARTCLQYYLERKHCQTDSIVLIPMIGTLSQLQVFHVVMLNKGNFTLLLLAKKMPWELVFLDSLKLAKLEKLWPSSREVIAGWQRTQSLSSNSVRKIPLHLLLISLCLGHWEISLFRGLGYYMETLFGVWCSASQAAWHRQVKVWSLKDPCLQWRSRPTGWNQICWQFAWYSISHLRLYSSHLRLHSYSPCLWPAPRQRAHRFPKGDNDVRPIGMGSVIRKLCSQLFLQSTLIQYPSNGGLNFGGYHLKGIQ